MQEYEFDFILFKIPTKTAKGALKKEGRNEGREGRKKKERKLISALQTEEDHHPHARRNIRGLSTM